MQQQGGSQYGVPPLEMVPQFPSAGGGARQPRMIGIHGGVDHLQHQSVAEAASPISSRSAPQPQVLVSRSPAMFFDELGGGNGGTMARGFADEEALGAGEEGERGGGVGSRWPRQETLALLKIRSEMDAVFRDATLKGPLWEDVSRKLAELGFKRSAKKCKEKFENVHKYYKRTKEGRAGRQDGKSYRFFSQLEALHSNAAIAGANVSSFSSAPNINSLPLLTADASGPTGASMAVPPVDRVQPLPAQHSALEPDLPLTAAAAAAGISFSSNTSSSSSSESDGEDTDDGGGGALQDGSRKRKRVEWPCGSGKMMAFFEGLMKQLMERQEAMQQRFLETIEKREQDRMVREEAWKRQEMARLNREYELMAQERTMTANRDAAVISFLQKFTGAGVNNPPNPLLEAAAISAPVPSEPSLEEPPPQDDQPESQRIHQGNEIVIHQPSVSSEPAASSAEMATEVIAGGCLDIVSLSSSKSSPSSRWPKAEVITLIKLRSGLETRYMETGPKGPLWEEISLGMKRLGYNRSTKRCKEKWENINKYFKKVKEGNKKRPEDAKTCPYFHELDALYRKKQQQDGTAANLAPPIFVLSEQEGNNGGHKNPVTIRSNIGNGGNHEGGGFQMPRSNADGHSQVFFGGTPNSGNDAALKKPEDIVKELMEQQNHEKDDDDDVDDDDYDDDDEEDGKLRYEIQFQRQSVGSAGGSRSGNAAGKGTAPAPPSSNAGSFLAMVQ